MPHSHKLSKTETQPGGKSVRDYAPEIVVLGLFVVAAVLFMYLFFFQYSTVEYNLGADTEIETMQSEVSPMAGTYYDVHIELKEDNNVDRINIIGPDGTAVSQYDVPVGETSVTIGVDTNGDLEVVEVTKSGTIAAKTPVTLERKFDHIL